MSHDITPQPDSFNEIVQVNETPLDQHPALVYLAGLTSANSRRMMQRHLNTIALWLGLR